MSTIYNVIRSCVFLTCLSSSLFSCRKLVDIPPPTDRISNVSVYTDKTTAVAALNGIYTLMAENSGSFTGDQSISCLTGLSSDELDLFNGATSNKHIAYYQNALTAQASGQFDHWANLYRLVYQCNAAIEGLGGSPSLDTSTRRQLMGEAKFLRAFYYFYIVTLYGNAPLVLTTDYKANAILKRADKTIVYEHIIADLKDAKSLLSPDYLDGSLLPYTGEKERLRPTKWAASALLARVNLFSGDFTGAVSESSEVIAKNDLFTIESLNEVFIRNSSESIWQLQPTSGFYNTEDGQLFDLSGTGPNEYNKFVYLNKQLVSSFEPGDQRRVMGNWIDSIDVNGIVYYYPYKYKNNIQGNSLTEYLTVLRLSEQMLIRSEAYAQLNDVSSAQADLNVIRSRAGLTNIASSDQTSLLNAILQERRAELFTEWGHRWLDLKRTGNIDSVMSTVTPAKVNAGTWKSFQQWYPIPLSDIQRDPNLIQNEGY